jgi:hypothetical protein
VFLSVIVFKNIPSYIPVIFTTQTVDKTGATADAE